MSLILLDTGMDFSIIGIILNFINIVMKGIIDLFIQLLSEYPILIIIVVIIIVYSLYYNFFKR